MLIGLFIFNNLTFIILDSLPPFVSSMSFTEETHTDRKVASGPQMNTLYSDPDFLAPDPECVNEKVNTGNVIFNWGGVKIAKISSEVVVKFGSHVTISEAKNMVFVKKKIQKMYLCQKFSPVTPTVQYTEIPTTMEVYTTRIFS